MEYSIRPELLPTANITVSVVSHGQSALINQLLEDLKCCKNIRRIVITQNLEKDIFKIPRELASRIILIKNNSPKGFGANHNFAFSHCKTPYFCILNPDIRLTYDLFPNLLEAFKSNLVGIVAPRIINHTGGQEDSARRFPSPMKIFRRLLKIDAFDYTYGEIFFEPEWVAGMFMLFSNYDFMRIGGFDEAFFLYCEDVDICLRLRSSGKSIVVAPKEQAIHAAQRTSHRKLIYLRWHIQSMIRLWRKYPRFF
jgi:N-acetylglucosaminyl-diphospho-decaprenol L-rhamnosyltransferase